MDCGLHWRELEDELAPTLQHHRPSPGAGLVEQALSLPPVLPLVVELLGKTTPEKQLAKEHTLLDQILMNKHSKSCQNFLGCISQCFSSLYISRDFLHLLTSFLMPS